MSDEDLIARLQRWYAAQCDGEWEHSYGVRIDTLDNPGWSVDIDLRDTDLSGMRFEPVNFEEGDEWLVCDVAEDQFRARCSPLQLGAALRIFLEYAGRGRGK